MSDIAIVTANIGDYDAPSDQAGVHYLSPPPLPGEHPRMTAKRVKMLDVRPTIRVEVPDLGKAPPYDTVPGGDYRWIIWVDANMTITSPSFAEDMVEICAEQALAVWEHPDRDCIYEEMVASFALAPEKYAGQPLREQVIHYESAGYPPNNGLYACGVVVWNLQHPDTEELAKRWLAECQAWSYQDQLSLPYVLWDMDLQPALLPYNLRLNPWIQIGAHNRSD